MGATAIAVRGLRVSRGGRTVLHGLTFAVAPGRVTGLLGPSGCGKTTLVRSIVGVQIVQSGEVEVLGKPAGSRVLRSRVAYMPQQPAIYPDLTVSENLRYFARVLGAGPDRVHPLRRRTRTHPAGRRAARQSRAARARRAHGRRRPGAAA